MQTLSQSALSTLYVQTLVQVTSIGGYDPTSDSVTWAFTNASAYPSFPPGDDDWNPGSWVTWPGPLYYAQILVGPENGGVTLPAGLWQSWLHITDSPEVPVLTPFLLQVT